MNASLFGIEIFLNLAEIWNGVLEMLKKTNMEILCSKKYEKL